MSHRLSMTPEGELTELQREVTARTAGRKRIPTIEGVLHLLLRIASLLASFVFLGFIVTLAINYKGIHPVTYIAVSLKMRSQTLVEKLTAC